MSRRRHIHVESPSATYNIAVNRSSRHASTLTRVIQVMKDFNIYALEKLVVEMIETLKAKKE